MESQSILCESKFASLISKSRDEFIKVFKKYNELKAKQLYLLILNEIEKTISLGNVVKFKNINKVIDCISNIKNRETLQHFYENPANTLKNTNLIILSCKHNKIEILQHLFDENNKILEQLTFSKESNLPKRKDDSTHDAFYYAIRSGNLKLLETLINKWPGDYFATNSEELDEVLSTAYEELKLKNVLLTEEIIVFVENKLINLRFFSNGKGNNNDVLNNIKERISLVVENIKLLNDNTKTDIRFLYIAKFIAQNVYILKRQLKCAYARLPWEEIEFCLVAFISCQTKQQEINIFYQAILSKNNLLEYLNSFAKKLEKEKELLDANASKLFELPKLQREQVIAKIMQNCPEFTELYNKYQEIIDVYSLDKINKYIKLALLANPDEKQGQLIIIRVLQVMGEYLKNTLESPKLSHLTSELLLLSLPNNTRKIIMNLRNSLSHAYSLSSRSEIEKTANVDFFIGVQNDSKKIGDIIADILCQKKIKTIRMFLLKIISSEDIDEIEEITTILDHFEVDKILSTKFVMTDLERIELLIKKFKKFITTEENELFQHIENIVNLEKNKSENNDFTIKYALCGIKTLTVFFRDKIDLKGLKFRANFILNNMTAITESSTLKLIVEKLKIISVKLHLNDQHEALQLLWEIFFIIEQILGKIKWIEKFKGKLNEKTQYNSSKESKNYKITKEKYNDQLALKLSELKSILRNKEISSIKNNYKLQAVIEMLLLDILLIIGSAGNLENNLFFMDDNTSLLTGKNLRNHLAHYNAIIDISLFDPSLSIFLNAEKLTNEKLFDSKKKIGKVVINDLSKLKVKFDQNLGTIRNQELLFAALEEGNFEKVKNYLKKGADIYARNSNSLTTLHLATIGSNIEIIKFIIAQNVKGENLLHIAAANGVKHLVEFFITELKLPVNEVDRVGKTPLHMAALSGHIEIIKILLKNKAYINCQDQVLFSPLFYAVRLNHIDAVKYLFYKTDVTEVMGGNTLLHEAAEKGYLELSKVLLEKGVDVNAKNERNWTPLHAAAYNGYLEIVNLFLRKGANVNAKVINGCTALYYAVENGNENIVDVLVKHGAAVNVFVRSSNTTPLHTACHDGKDQIVKILLNSKANPNVTDSKGLTPLHLAALKGHLLIVHSLLGHGVDINVKDKNKCSPLHWAVKNGHQDIVDLLIKNKADMNAKNDKGITLLHSAALEGHVHVVDILLKNNCSANARDLNYNTPLHYAAVNDSKQIAETLIRNKSEINAKNKLNMTALHKAALFGSYKIAELLVKHGANINCIEVNHNTPLHFAVEYGHKHIINLLLKNKSNVNAINIKKQTPLDVGIEVHHKDIIKILLKNEAQVNEFSLIAAVKSNDKEMVKIIIANGADVNVDNGVCLTYAIMAGLKDIIDILLKNNAPINLKLKGNITLLHVAANYGDEETAKILIEKGANVNALNDTKYTPLHVATKKRCDEIVKLLIENKANVNEKSSGVTALQIATVKGHTNIAQMLLDNKANVFIKDYDNRTVFELAVAYGRLEIVKMLLKTKKINLNAKGNSDFRVLHIASQEKNLEMVKYLVDNGAGINARNVSGSKPIHIAAREGFIDAVKFFLDKGLSINELGTKNQTLLHYAALNKQLEVVKLLLSNNADVNAKDKVGLTPLHLAAYFNYKDIIEILLENGAFFNIVDEIGRTPADYTFNPSIKLIFIQIKNLFHSVKSRDFLTLQNCIEEGAFVNAKNVANETPLLHAAWKGNNKIVEILLKNKGDPNILAKKGFTALHYASKFSHLGVVKTLLLNGAIYNITSDNGTTPQDLSVDSTITGLFQLLNKAFKMIKNGNTEILNDLDKINSIEKIKIVMHARNTEKKTLIVAAMHNNFPEVDKLKQILYYDVSAKLQKVLTLSQNGFDEEALNLLKEIHENRKTLLGPDNPSTLDIQTHIGKILYKQGKYKEALNLFKVLLVKQNEILGANYKDTLITRSTIAAILHKLNKNNEAHDIYQDVYQKLIEVLGPDHDDTLITEFDMGLVLCSLGKFDEALNIYKKSYKRSQEKGVAKDHRTLKAQNNIALVLSNQGKHEEALKIYKEVYEKKKDVLGNNHIETLRTLDNIAEILLQQKKYHESLKAFEELYVIKKKVLGPKHPETLNTQFNLSRVLHAQHKWIAALKSFKECLSLRNEVFGSTDPIAALILKNIETIHLYFKLRGSNDSEILEDLQEDIYIAVSNGDIETVQLLLEHGFDINEKDTDERTTLHYAVSNRHLEIIQLLIKHGADATQVTSKGNTVLHIAASKDFEDIVVILLQHVNQKKPANFNNFINAKTNNGGTTALHVAAKNGFRGIVKILLEYGAIYNCVNNDNKTPLEISNDLDVVYLLRFTSELFDDAKIGNFKMISKLKETNTTNLKAVFYVRNIADKTLLHILIINEHIDIVRKLGTIIGSII